MSGVVLATGGYDHVVRLIDPTSGATTRSFKVPDSQVNALAVSSDKRFVAAALNPCVKIFDLASRSDQPVAYLEGHVGNVTGVGFDADTRWIFTAGEDGTVRIYDPRAGTGANALQRLYEAPPAAAVAAASAPSAAAASGAPPPSSSPPPGSSGGSSASASAAVNICPAGNASAAAVAAMQGTRPSSAANTASWSEQRRNAVNGVVLHPNQCEIACCDQGGRVRIYDLTGASTQPVLVLIPEPDVSVRSLSIAADGHRLICATDSGNVHQFAPSTGDSLVNKSLLDFDKVTRAHDAYILKCQVSPDLKLIATASADHQCKIWRTSDMRCVKVLAKHQRWVHDIQFSADSSYLISASSDHSARLWDVATGEMVRNFSAPKAVTAVALNDTGGGGGGGGGGANA